MAQFLTIIFAPKNSFEATTSSAIVIIAMTAKIICSQIWPRKNILCNVFLTFLLWSTNKKKGLYLSIKKQLNKLNA
jgi:hypothetical protein